MANDSAKKAIAHAANIQPRYIRYGVIVTLVYFILRFIWQWKTLTFDSVFVFLLFAALTMLLIRQVIQNAKDNVSIEGYQDCLIVHGITQILSTISPWFCLLYLSIPAYLVFTHRVFLRQVLGFIMAKFRSSTSI